MSLSLTFPRRSDGKLHVTAAGAAVAFAGDPSLYDGDWFRKTVTVTTDAIMKASISVSNYKSQVNIAYDLWYDFSPYSGTWTLANQSAPPFYNIGEAVGNWYTTPSIPTCICHLDNISVSPSNGKTFAYQPAPYLYSGTGQHNYYNRLRIQASDLSKWRCYTGWSYSLQVKMLWEFVEGGADGYFIEFASPTSFLWEKANSVASGHSVRGTYACTPGEQAFSLASGSWVVSA